MKPLRPSALRIASLVPSLTELAVSLGLGPCLVARTGFCIHPANVVGAVPKVGGTKDVNLRKLRELAPTHVLVNVDENTLPVVQALRSFVPEVVVTHPCSPHDVLGLIDQLASTFGETPGVAERGAVLRAELASALADCQGEPIDVPVLYLIWRDPWMTVAQDTYISRLLACANWRTLPAVQGGAHGAARYPVVRGDEPWLREVQQVLLSSEPYAFNEAHLQEAQSLCPNARVQLVDGELLSWYGPRTAQGLRYVQQLALA
jgi:ABC-type hemin transport system substrate-binding protein